MKPSFSVINVFMALTYTLRPPGATPEPEKVLLDTGRGCVYPVRMDKDTCGGYRNDGSACRRETGGELCWQHQDQQVRDGDNMTPAQVEAMFKEYGIS